MSALLFLLAILFATLSAGEITAVGSVLLIAAAACILGGVTAMEREMPTEG